MHSLSHYCKGMSCNNLDCHCSPHRLSIYITPCLYPQCWEYDVFLHSHNLIINSHQKQQSKQLCPRSMLEMRMLSSQLASKQLWKGCKTVFPLSQLAGIAVVFHSTNYLEQNGIKNTFKSVRVHAAHTSCIVYPKHKHIWSCIHIHIVIQYHKWNHSYPYNRV